MVLEQRNDEHNTTEQNTKREGEKEVQKKASSPETRSIGGFWRISIDSMLHCMTGYYYLLLSTCLIHVLCALLSSGAVNVAPITINSLIG